MGRNSNNLRYADDTILMAESEEELKSHLMRVKEERVKSWLKTQHSTNKDHDLWPIISLQIVGKTKKTERFIFSGSEVFVDSDCSHEIKKKISASWKKSYHQTRQHVKKQRCYFADKGLYSQMYGFSSSHVQMGELDHKER